MPDIIVSGSPNSITEFRELTSDEIICVSGGFNKEVTGALAGAAAIGATTWGSAWGIVSVGAAFAAAPVAVVAMGALVAYAGYSYMRSRNG